MECSQYVSININLSPYIMLHIFPLETLSSRTPGMGMVILRWRHTQICWVASYHGEGVCVVVLCFFVCKYSLCFILCFGHWIVHAWVPCSSGLANAKQPHENPRTVFYKDETTAHLPHDVQQSMHYSYVQSWKAAVTGCSNGQHWDQTTSTVKLFWASANAFNFELGLFINAVLRQKLKVFFM